MASAVFDPYKVLNVNQNATQEDIKAAFRKLSKEHHPDVSTGDDSQDFVIIKKAYEILINKQKRDTYDLYGVVVDFHNETKNLAFRIFLDVASRCEKDIPLDAEIKAFVETALLPKYEDEIKAIEKNIDKLQSRISRIVKKPEDDFLTERIQKVLEDGRHNLKMAILQRDLHKAALELLKQYKFDLEQIGNSEFHNIFGNQTGKSRVKRGSRI